VHRFHVVLTAALAATGALIAGCGGDDQAVDPGAGPTTATEVASTSTQPPVETTPAEPPPTPTPSLPGLPSVDRAAVEGYLDWSELSTPPAPALAAQASGAHQGTKRVFLGRAADTDTAPFPPGAVVVKEGRTDDDITLIAIMEKIGEVDDATGGWRYVEYTRASSASRFEKVSFPETGCAACHAQAKATDFIFTTK
jgi:hypothetical protein